MPYALGLLGEAMAQPGVASPTGGFTFVQISDSHVGFAKLVNPDPRGETFAGLDRESSELATELRAAAAAKWYEVGRVSQEVAAQIAGVSRSEFVSVLSRLQVSSM